MFEIQMTATYESGNEAYNVCGSSFKGWTDFLKHLFHGHNLFL